MLLFRITGKTIEPLAPHSAPIDNETLFDLDGGERKSGKTRKYLREMWAAKFPGIVPEEKITGESIGDPMSRPKESRTAVLALSVADRDELVRTLLYPQLPQNVWPAFKLVCDQRRLSIYCRHLFPEYRYDGATDAMKLVIITSIEAVRLLARRSGQCEGATDIEWGGPDRVWTNAWNSEADGPPTFARCGVYRKGDREAMYAVVEWSSYCPYVATADGTIPDPFWLQWAALMLGKCAEVAAYRRTLPEELDGIYTRDEMRQADNFGPPLPPKSSTREDSDQDETSQLPPLDVDEDEINELFAEALPDAKMRTLALSSFKVKYARLWRGQSTEFFRCVARDLRAMIEQRRAG